MGLTKSEKGGQEMAAALVEVDEVRVEATIGEPDGVKVRPEVSKPPTNLNNKQNWIIRHDRNC